METFDYTQNLDALIEIIERKAADKSRLIVAIAGPPAGGKSTLSEKLFEYFLDDAAILPMDGYHIDNNILDTRNLRSIKGAPETFDFGGFEQVVKAARDERPFYAAKFDRDLDLSRGSARYISSERIVFVEGNYLLFDENPWRALTQYWDLAIWVSEPLEELQTRLISRWLSHGFSTENATKKAMENDIPNAKRVIDNRLI